MEWSASSGIDNELEATLNAEVHSIRLFQVARQSADVLQNDVKGKWERYSTESMYEFSAVAYSFGKKLYDELKVPVGMLVCK